MPPRLHSPLQGLQRRHPICSAVLGETMIVFTQTWLLTAFASVQLYTHFDSMRGFPVSTFLVVCIESEPRSLRVRLPRRDVDQT
jgi:hypothetical protein